MRLPASAEEQEKQERFVLLASTVKQEKAEKLRERLIKNPFPTIEESALGAFMEMYEPHLVPVVAAFLVKGYLVEPSSGFGKEHPECQMLYGQFSLEDKIVNLLGKIGVIVCKEKNNKFIKFYPAEPNTKAIVEKYMQILALFPALKGDIVIAQTPGAKKFRRTYTPQDSDLKKTRLFEILMYDVHVRVAESMQKRLSENPKPSTTEMNLGVFIEKIEPQVRDAVLEFNRKGYSTDASGFLGRSDLQRIEGDFSLDEVARKRLESEGVSIVTNHSGYTCIEFQPKEADFDSIYKKWMEIAAVLPDRKKLPPPSMTINARDFRKKYQGVVNQ